MKFNELKKHLSTMKLKPSYVIVGEDGFLIASAVKHFKKLILAMEEINLTIFNETSDGVAVADACEALPMLSKYRVILCFNYKGGDAPILKYLLNPNPCSVLVFIKDGKLSDSLAKITAKSEIVECSKLDAAQITRWAVAKLDETGAKIEADAMQKLMGFCGYDMSRISRETEKLALYKPDGIITVDDIENLVFADAEYNVFALTDAAAKKDTVLAAKILKSLIDSGSQPVTLLSLIYSHFRRMLYCAVNAGDPSLSYKLGVKEYAVSIAARQAKAFSVRRLKNICDFLSETEFKIKSGFMPDRIGLETALLSIF